MIPTKTDLPGDTLAIGLPPEDDEDEEPVEENELLELEQELCLLEEKLLNFCCLKPSFSNTNLHHYINKNKYQSFWCWVPGGVEGWLCLLFWGLCLPPDLPGVIRMTVNSWWRRRRWTRHYSSDIETVSSVSVSIYLTNQRSVLWVMWSDQPIRAQYSLWTGIY